MPSIFRTLRFRIAAAFFLWTGLIQVALFVALPVARDAYLIDAVDRRLSHMGQSLVDAALAGAPPSELAATTGLRSVDPSALQVRVEDDQGVVLAGSQLARELPRAEHPGHATVKLARDGQDEAERYRVARFDAQLPGGRVERIEVAQSLAAADGITRSVQRVLVIGLVLGLLGSAAAGWVVSGAIVSRINRVSRALREVAPTRLDQRIDLPVGGDEIGKMAADVNQMLERMAVAFRSQERFMSEVSHELKTPVSALLTEAQVLKHTRTSPRPPAPSPVAVTNGSPHPLLGGGDARAHIEPYERFVLSVEEEMRWLGKLVESFLMLARFGHGKQFVAEGVVAINDVVLDAVEHSTLYARQHGVTLALTLHDPGETGEDAVVRGDAELLRVVADNLIRNAVQFSKRGDTVTVKVSMEPAERQGAPMVVFTVKDQGPGVPEEYLVRIFDRFAQAPGKRSTRRGSGLGLTIAKGVTDLHGGTIDARNAAEGGCIFRVRLPAHQPSPQESGPAAP